MAPQRRTVLKGISGIASAGALGGCVGGGGDGDRVGIALAPDGILGIAMDHIYNQTSILEDAISDAGYEMEVDESWEDAAIFASGQADFSTMSSLEAAQLAGERDRNLAVFGRIHPQYMGWMVENGGEYDPEETGSVEESITKLVEDDALVGIGAWNGGHVPVDTVILDELYGYEFAEEGGDFEVTTADYIAIPQLIVDGELAAGSTSPEHGGARFMVDDPPGLTELFWGADIAEENGFGLPMLNSLVTTQSFMDERQDAAEAFANALQEGISWFLDDPKGIVLDNQEYIEMMGVETAEEAEYIIDWGINLEYSTDQQMVYEEITMDSDAIEADKEFIDYSANIGFVPENWEDRVSYHEF